MEVDFMEVYDNVPSWKSLTLTHDKVISNNKPSRVRGKQYVIDEPDLTTSSSKWQNIGFEFTPDLIRFWRYENNQWIAQPKTIFIKKNASNGSSNENKSTAEIKTTNVDMNMYWILSNVFFKKLSDDRDRDNDVFLDIDHFLYYPFKK